MKPMAILAVLIGALELLNALVEGWAGRGNVADGSWLVGVTLGVVASALLMGAGIGLLRRGRSAASWARMAAIACLTAFVLIRVVEPWMSIASMILGIGFSIGLALFLFITRLRGPEMPRSA